MRRPALFLSAALAAAAPSQAQTPTLGGGAYLDYNVRLAPDSVAGTQRFAVRRAWLAATVQAAPRLTARLRVETDERTVPALRLYDAWVRRDSLGGSAHALTLGLLPTAAIQRHEALWGHRFLERTAVTHLGLLSSRDLGAELSGPLGPARYAVSFTGSRGARSTVGNEGRISLALFTRPDAPLQAVGSFDQVWREDGPGRVANVSLAHVTERLRVGGEVLMQANDTTNATAAALFAAPRLSARWRLVGRAEAVRRKGVDGLDMSGLAGAVYRLDEALELAPHVRLNRAASREVEMQLRLTASLRF